MSLFHALALAAVALLILVLSLLRRRNKGPKFLRWVLFVDCIAASVHSFWLYATFVRDGNGYGAGLCLVWPFALAILMHGEEQRSTDAG
ncbi:MAG TPA: hypothetical protein VGB97_00345 [Candidatus Paceibacterota bacterium]|jgi:hypothetical protein